MLHEKCMFVTVLPQPHLFLLVDESITVRILEGDKQMQKKSVLTALTLTLIAALTGLPIMQIVTAVPPAPVTLDPKTIPKYVNQLSDVNGDLLPPPVYVPEYSTPTAEYYTIDVTQFTQQILPTVDVAGNPTGFGATTVWGYGGQTTVGYIANAPGPTFEATQGKEIVRLQTGRKIIPPHSPKSPSVCQSSLN